jgi:hypothetical protein
VKAKKPDEPKQKRPYIGRCSSLSEVRAELSRLYRAARLQAGPNPDPDAAYKLALILTATAKLIESSELVARLAEVERRTAEAGEYPSAPPLRRIS